MADLEDVPLFGLPEPPLPPAGEALSADERRTRKQLAALERGRHPLGGRLHPNAAPADDRRAPGLRCRHCMHVTSQAGRHLRCTARPISRGPATDVRLWWPACELLQRENA